LLSGKFVRKVSCTRSRYCGTSQMCSIALLNASFCKCEHLKHFAHSRTELLFLQQHHGSVRLTARRIGSGGTANSHSCETEPCSLESARHQCRMLKRLVHFLQPPDVRILFCLLTADRDQSSRRGGRGRRSGGRQKARASERRAGDDSAPIGRRSQGGRAGNGGKAMGADSGSASGPGLDSEIDKYMGRKPQEQKAALDSELDSYFSARDSKDATADSSEAHTAESAGPENTAAAAAPQATDAAATAAGDEAVASSTT